MVLLQFEDLFMIIGLYKTVVHVKFVTIVSSCKNVCK